MITKKLKREKKIYQNQKEINAKIERLFHNKWYNCLPWFDWINKNKKKRRIHIRLYKKYSSSQMEYSE